jgi:glucan phosphoethanolaminetransferase (alkaline phosphatase superfamily)
MPDRLKLIAWAGIPASVLLIDMVVRWNGGLPPDFMIDPTNALLSVMISGLFWWSVSRLIGQTQRRWMWAALVAVPYAVVLTLSWRYRLFAHKDINAGILAYVWLEPKNAAQLASAGWSYSVALVGAAIGGVWTYCLGAWSGEVSRVSRRTAVVIVAGWFVVAYTVPPASPLQGTNYVSDFNITNVFGAFLGRLDAPSAHREVLGRAEDRREVEPVELGEYPNVLVIIGETLVRDRMSLYGHDRPTTRRMDAFAEEYRNEVFHFDRAYTASAFSPLSVASIVLGRYVKYDRQTLHRAPTLWQYGKAAGAKTALVTPQSWTWSAMNLFFLLDGGPDVHATAEDFEAPVVNDTGVSDHHAGRRLVEFLEDDLAADESFVAVLQTNATHFPFLAPADLPWEDDTLADRYDGSMTVVDALFGRIVDTLERTGRLDDTVIILTSDHGEFFFDQLDELRESDGGRLTPDVDQGQRTDSCHPAITHIPMFVFVPERWQRQREQAVEALRENRDRVVSNVDILPTMLALMGFGEVGTGPDGSFDGHSLTEPVPAGRTAMCFTEPGWDTWLKSGVGLFSEQRLLYVREDFPALMHFAPRHIESTAPVGGRAADAADWAWLAEQADQYPLIARALQDIAAKHPIEELASRLADSADPK